ncbi:hypothetical protein [Actinomadura rupiterrae]|uniref:hypothetical protein n=1 Tax=Actinomadura rupiterrae TaxID=559627 RepID=UPI0020A347F2|nr:hypothetical protein [Actinomadura rupiterrae]MCP2337919.1 hypothetical protein [Actinomadura rupiterrae]
MNRRVLLLSTATAVTLDLGTLALMNHGDEVRTTRPTSSSAVLQLSPATPLDGLTWQDFHGLRMPYSASEGPHTVAGDRVAGFGHSPLGALLAAVHLSVRSDPRWGLATAMSTVNTQFVGPDTIGMLASINTAPPPPSAPHAYVVLEGFRWQGYTPETASLDVVSAGPGDSDQVVRAATRIQLQWRDGDWRVLAPPGGSWQASATPVNTLDGYTRFPTPGGGR